MIENKDKYKNSVEYLMQKEIDDLKAKLQAQKQQVDRLCEGIAAITKVTPAAFSNLSPIEVIAMSPTQLIKHVKQLLAEVKR